MSRTIWVSDDVRSELPRLSIPPGDLRFTLSFRDVGPTPDGFSSAKLVTLIDSASRRLNRLDAT
jgi:hypothetical protein